MKNKRIWLVMLLVVMLTGCGDQHILERSGFNHTISYDLLPNGSFKIAISVPKADPESKVDREILKTTALSSKDARPKLVRQTQLHLVNGQLRNTLFGMDLAKAGLLHQMDTLLRDPTIPPRIKITITDGDALSILEKNYKEHPRTDRYIFHLLEKEASYQNIPASTLHEFIRDYYDDGIDPIAPIIKDAGDHIAIDGIGLFRGDQYITKIMPEDFIIFALLRLNLRQSEITINLGDGENHKELITLSSLRSKRDVVLQHDQHGRPMVVIHIKAYGSVLEYIGNKKLNIEADQKKLVKQASENLSERGDQLMKFMQKNKVDSVGIGTYIRNSMTFKSWKALDWYEEYSHLPIKCSFSLKIINSGESI